MKIGYLPYIITLIVISCIVMAGSAQATDYQVIIRNETSQHCTPDLSCYKPYQVNIGVGDTITWTNKDNKTHTATTGSSNYGPVGIFDSGSILPGHNYTQFFGSVGTYRYFDKADNWPSGIIVVTKVATYSHLTWVPNSLTVTKANHTSNGVVITKQIQNSGNANANSVIFRLKIRNQTDFQMYDNIVRLDVPSNTVVPVSFAWDSAPPGKYSLIFDDNAVNNGGNVNATYGTSLELISIANNPPPPQPNIVQNFTLASNQTTSVPEFGSTSYLILLASIVSIVIFSAKSTLKIRLFS